MHKTMMMVDTDNDDLQKKDVRLNDVRVFVYSGESRTDQRKSEISQQFLK